MEKSGINSQNIQFMESSLPAQQIWELEKDNPFLGKFPNISEKGNNEKKFKEEAKKHGLQARGVGGEHSAMDK
jgi:hypothetical protein